jgi:hypothetical protein
MNGRRIQTLSFWITDEANNEVDLSAETWTIRVKISYDLVLILK